MFWGSLFDGNKNIMFGTMYGEDSGLHIVSRLNYDCKVWEIDMIVNNYIHFDIILSSEVKGNVISKCNMLIYFQSYWI